MDKLTIDGEEVIRFRLRSDEDGGLVLVTMVPDGNGEYFEHREWIGHGIFQDGVNPPVRPNKRQRDAAQNEARTRYAAMTESDIRERVNRARQQSESKA